MEPKAIPFDKNASLRKKKRTKLALVFVGVLIIISVLVVTFLRKKEFHIQEVVVSGTRALDPGEVVRAVETVTSGSWLGLVPKTSTLLFSKRAAVHAVRAQVPSIEKISFHFSTGNILEVDVQEKQPRFVWCSDVRCYFVDESGIMYKESLVFSPGVFLSFQGSTFSIPDSVIGSSFVTHDEFLKLLGLVQKIQEFPAVVTSVTIRSDGDIALGVASFNNINLGNKSTFFVTWETTTEEIKQSLDLLVTNSEFAQLLATRGTFLESIDMRFSGKVYYTFLP